MGTTKVTQSTDAKSSTGVIENLRKIAGTLPSENPIKRNDFLNLSNSIEVELIDHNENPYKAMFTTATATWGDNNYKNKWNDTTSQGKLEVIKAVLTNNTLPQAREMVNFIFRVRGVPRWLFDKHTQIPFTTFMSIGCRDNNKLDSDFIFQDEKILITQEEKDTLNELKDLYEYVITKGNGSWQSARTFLPQCYQHSYYFGQNLLSMASMKFDVNDTESKMLRLLYQKIREEIKKKFCLISDYLVGNIDNKPEISKEYMANYFSEFRYDLLTDTDKEYFERK